MTRLLAAAALVLAASAAHAETLADLGLQEHWYGEALDREELAGRTVVVDFWGLT